MNDLNDLAYLVKVVEHQGFAPAARALGMQKSKLSRRIAALEERLGVRLIQRSTRKFSVTDIGQSYYQHCLAMLVEAEAAQEAIDAIRAEPAGLIRIACPPGLIAYRMGAAVAGFMAASPKVRIQLKAYNRPVDIIREGFDVVIRTGEPGPQSGSLVMRKLGEVSQCLVASPALLADRPPPATPSDLTGMPAIGLGTALVNGAADHVEWVLTHESGATALIPAKPRLVSDDLAALRAGALAGLGIVQMPNLMIEADRLAGRLVTLLPQWASPNLPVHAVFPSRRGLLPSIRALIDHLAGDCQPFRQGTP
ncbi:MAG: LysR family transcriptional regulator [Phenylobacterium sp.]|uniref:LysR substrate-binding domain-containing protein n=1 Tax=Phenylobacterium sp. TaxID=1871053 RepID=UPI001A5DADF4|nr:LysR substrate-binding domain-containing protein [Phenylobacterium sp.]MBL8553859.1 LysR family transcriptional regulator [Phenylobacterium sp.]